MTDADFRDALRLLDSALVLLLHPRRSGPTAAMRREFRALSLECDLLRLRLGKTAVNAELN